MVDAGPLVAYLDEDDEHHAACRALLENHPGPLLVPTLVITEVAHLVDRDLGPTSETAFLADIVEGSLEPVPLEPADWRRILDLVWTYRDLPLGAVDASIVAQAERLRIRQIATLDRRDFSVVRPTHVDAFELLP